MAKSPSNTLTKPHVTVEQVRRLFAYDAATGCLFWAVDRYGKPAGDKAGGPDPAGYVVIRIHRKNYLAHRLTWMHQTGDMPPPMLDHIDGCRDNNRISNLRPADGVLNSENRRRASIRSNTGLLGVQDQSKFCIKNPFKASIHAQGKTHRLGAFPTAEAAHAAYIKAKRQLHAGNTL